MVRIFLPLSGQQLEMTLQWYSGVGILELPVHCSSAHLACSAGGFGSHLPESTFLPLPAWCHHCVTCTSWTGQITLDTKQAMPLAWWNWQHDITSWCNIHKTPLCFGVGAVDYCCLGALSLRFASDSFTAYSEYAGSSRCILCGKYQRNV